MLIQLLEFYGDFEIDKREINMRTLKMGPKNSSYPGFSLKEPLYENNVGRNCFKFLEIQLVFKRSVFILKNTAHLPKESVLKALINPQKFDFEEKYLND